MRKKPPVLKKGDAVAIVATARKVNLDELNFAIRLLESWELNPIIGSSIGLSNHQFAGSDQERATDFQNQLNDPKIKTIWCARGGYGTVRMLDLIDFSNFKNHPKWIIGYSDVTAIHAHLQSENQMSIHAEMPALIEKKTQTTADSLKQMLFGKNLFYQWENSGKFYRNGGVEAELVGGNLSVLYSLLGSKSSIHPKNKILFLEDLDEYLYHIDRMMQNLKRNHWFDQLAGLIVGGMNEMNDNQIPFGKNAEEIIWEYVKDYDFPVSFHFPAGHLKENLALKLGSKVSFKVNLTESSLRFL